MARGEARRAAQGIPQRRRLCRLPQKFSAIADEQTTMSEVMEGNLNWPAIFAACEDAGVKWYLVERDQGPTEAFESLAISYRNLKKAGFE